MEYLVLYTYMTVAHSSIPSVWLLVLFIVAAA